jgi:hypothetical protein
MLEKFGFTRHMTKPGPLTDMSVRVVKPIAATEPWRHLGVTEYQQQRVSRIRALERGVNGHGGRALVITVFGILTLGHHDVPERGDDVAVVVRTKQYSHRRRQRFWSRPSVNLGHVNGFQIVSEPATVGATVVAG